MPVDDRVLTVEQLYGLRDLAVHWRIFRPPTEPFDPAGRWQQSWRVMTLTGQGGRTGWLRLDHDPAGLLRAEYVKFLAGGSQRLVAEFTGLAGPLLAPVGWTASLVSRNDAGEPIPSTASEVSATVAPGELRVNGRRRVLGQAWAVPWSLFAAVPRLPREPGREYRFDLVDDLDTVKANHRLRYRNSHRVKFEQAPEPIVLHQFQHLGAGLHPTIYWLDDAGRLLLAFSGLEGWYWDSRAPETPR